MSILDTVKGWFAKKESKPKTTTIDPDRVSVSVMEQKYEMDDLVGAAKDLKSLLEIYGTRKKKNHRQKGREFIYFILSHKHKDLKNIGYKHWQNINQIIQLNFTKVYPYHKDNLRNAIDFFKKEIKGISEIDVIQ